MDIAVVGTGYVGLVTGACLASLGNSVVCLDVDEQKIDEMKAGRVPFFEPGLVDLVQRGLSSGLLSFTASYADALRDASFIFLCVGTPPKETGGADTRFVEDAVRSIGAVLDHDAYLVVKSTVPVGTNRALIEQLYAVLLSAGRDLRQLHVSILSNPEFLREGSAVQDFMKPDRIIIGCEERWAADILLQVYAPFDCPKLVVSLESSELAKYAANAFLATKISFINELAEVAERTGADIRDVATAIGLDPRIGTAFLRAGIGYGGSCFPKDVSALYQIAGGEGVNFQLLRATIEVNNRQRDRFVAGIRERLGDLAEKRIGVLGLAFKPDTDDIRASAAVDIVERLFAEGAEIIAYDPQAMANAKRRFGANISFADAPLDAARNVDALCVLTDWPIFRSLSPETLAPFLTGKHIFDGRNLLADVPWEEYGIFYHCVGVGSSRRLA